MKKIGLTLVLLSALAVAANATANLSPAGFKNTSKYCKALREDMGAQAFAHAFGVERSRSAHGRCVSRKGRLVVEEPPLAETPGDTPPANQCTPETPCTGPLPVTAFGSPQAATDPAPPGKHPEKQEKKKLR
jgi:hypothetical protein